jgi:hypothetical protein
LKASNFKKSPPAGKILLSPTELAFEMTEYIINVNQVEDFQMTSSKVDLEQIFTRAKSTIIQGGAVILTRKYEDGRVENFDELTTEADLEEYRKTVFKYL